MHTITRYIDGVEVKETVLDPEDFASVELREQRLSICDTCDCMVYDSTAEYPMQKSCTECSCLLVNRVSFQDSFCPEGKW